ncbi:SGNH/GDSL hydrolase family protein [Rathayibacter soli]|uniref:SGNH/GDSL hydrolase family protein n=1 Tax=Rathayibacter soli TaxID=3144168 RepID=UPI0027E4CF36|nr:SGNH/GDSL hydrolase family protein [Glaciibacter superstes]
MMFSQMPKALAMAASVALGLTMALTGAAAAGAQPVIVQRVTDAAPNGPVVVAIGDSIMEGHGLQPDQAWPAVVAEQYGWDLTNLASDGSGFVTVGNNDDTFVDQVAVAVRLHPSIVLISASSNDLGDPEPTVATATATAMQELRSDLPNAKIVVVSPVWNETAEPQELATFGQDVANVAASIGAVSLSIGQPLEGHPQLIQADDVHPTATGQRVIARDVAHALAATTA